MRGEAVMPLPAVWRQLARFGLVATACGCWTGSETEPPPRHAEPSHRVASPSSPECEPLSPEAGLSPADGGYRRLDHVGRDSLRGAIIGALNKHPLGNRAIGGRAFSALAAAVHDVRGELFACMRAADPGVPDLRYLIRLTLTGRHDVGAIVDVVSVRRVVLAPDQPATEVPTSAEKCFAEILTAIELPPSDGPAEFNAQLSADDPCVGSTRPEGQ